MAAPGRYGIVQAPGDMQLGAQHINKSRGNVRAIVTEGNKPMTSRVTVKRSDGII